MTIASVCFAILCAVLCLVPVSKVLTDGSGSNCVLAHTILFKSSLITIAPSILANSYMYAGLYSEFI